MSAIADNFEDKIRFLPSSQNIVSDCKKQRISLKDGSTNKKYEEWMISCIAEKDESYYLFRGYEKNRVFVSKIINEVNIVHYYAFNTAALI